MKYLLFTLEYPPFYGGVANYYANLVKYWPKSDNIFVLNNNEGELLSGRLWPHWLPAIAKLWYHSKKQDIDHIIVGQILPLGTAALLVKIISGKRYSLILHGMDLAFCLRSRRKKFIAGKIIGQAEKIICANNYTAKLLKDNFLHSDPDKIAIVNPGVENKPNVDIAQVEKLKIQYGLSGKIVLFSISRLVKRKGFDKVIDIMPELNRKIPDLVYIIAGKGPDEVYLKNQAGKVPNIIFIGVLDDNMKWAWLELCDIFIMPARNMAGDFEGFGIVYLEANIAGKTVIAGRSGGIPDAVAENNNGLLVDPENDRDILNTILKLAGDKDLRQKLGEQGRHRAETDFNWATQVQKIFDTLN